MGFPVPIVGLHLIRNVKSTGTCIFRTIFQIVRDDLAILIYQDEGVSRECLTHTFSTFSALLSSQYRVRGVSAKELIEGAWERSTRLLVFPGGADLPYMKRLKGVGNRRIRSYVEAGGSFIGICAGAYYSGTRLEFALGTSIEIKQERELKFFPGTVKGPVLFPFEYRENIGARAAKILSIFHKSKPVSIFYNGGGYFAGAEGKEKTEILATYGFSKQFPAIIECKVGKGRAILSGVHFEYDPELLDKEDPFLRLILPEIKESNVQRLELLRAILSRF